MTARTIVYSGLGSELEVFDCDPATGALTRLQSLQFSCVIQYGWPNRRRTVLYVATSDAGPMAKIKGPNHFVQAFSIAPDGSLAPLGPPVRLRNRPLHLSLDPSERHLLLAYNDPPDVTVHRIETDGAIGEEVPQPPLAFGPTVHQIMVTPPGTLAVVPACAHSEDGTPPGSVGIFRYQDGRLAPLARVEARPERAVPWQGKRNGAQGFAARHVDFHPTRPWMYLCVEAQGELHLYDYDAEGIALEPRFIRSTLEGAPAGRSSQLASAVHVHPGGRFVYVTNRAWDTERTDGHDVFVGGVNDIAVFAIDQETGEPSLIQHVDSLGIFPRTFGIDATGTLLVVGNQEPLMVRDGDGLRKILPSLVLFRVGPDGRLTFLRKHEHPDNGEVCFWVDVLTLDRTPS
jgi:6-phosphogluconolactonase (cycloisomerase 2 family)